MNAAERIYNASTREEGSPSRLADKLARQIEDDIASFNHQPGNALGSLRDLSVRYSVGRAVTREAIGLLERRGLGSLRPGPCGGFILRKPPSDFIGEELAEYFREIGVTLAQLLDAREAVDLMVARLASSAGISPIGLARLDVVGKTRGIAGHLLLRSELARLTREPAVILLVKCLNSLTLDFIAAEAGDAEPLRVVPMKVALASRNAQLAAEEMTLLHGQLARRLDHRSDHKDVLQTGTARPSDKRTLAASVARRISAEIVSSGTTGQRLGSEWDLCERFSVSRLTLRQAIRLLQDSGMVECRRGRGNGLVVRNQRGTGAIRLVLAYLIGRQMRVCTAGTILFQLNCFVPALSVGRANADQRRTLEALLTRIEASDSFDRYDLLNLVHCVSRTAESPIIDLFSRCLAAYEARFHPSLAERLPVSLQASYFRLVRRLLDRLPVEGPHDMEWAKAEAQGVMLEMSLRRPL